ncbi:MAG: TPM domain-containing protein [Candidatus Microbacterium phytovorans]|uniref:TPM domain-containing protein n=1 Tax=Candidatus Microbacterium phytovorans TaxID=3121374 RepID=A0AAJ6B5J7_9MICO|nr:TPM domain-containing protein [Microbacterium sp.]WEK13881.1 MAG: TPM domain-containing protein [Microbacterium sp.]
MRSRWMLALAATVSIVLGSALPASATDPIPLGSGRVLDDAGVLSASQEQAVQARSEGLSASSGVDLWVVYVDQFTDPTSAEGWANATAELNNLGPTQYLLAISTEGRAFFLSGYSEGPVSFDQLGAIEQDRIAPALQSGDWAGAATAAADGLADAVGGGSGGDANSSGGLGGVLFVVLLVVVVGALIFFVVRARRKSRVTTGGATPQAPQVPLEELARQASSALVDTDDAVKTSEQELGFARAQFGDAAAAEFETVLAQAKADLDTAFSLKQRLDDENPDSEQDARAWNAQILELCARANAALDEKAAAFDELRQLEQNAPEALTRVQEMHTTVAATIDAAAARLTQLQTAYAPEALAPVVDNPEQARQRLTFAQEQLNAAQTAIGAGDGGEAAVSIRAAEDAVAQARTLQDAIGVLADDLAEGERDAAALMAELEKDIATASALPDADGRVAGAIAATRQQIDAARPLLAGSAKRPLFALENLERANAEIDAVLADVRDAQEKERRAAQQLSQLLAHAQAQVSAAEDYISSRRGAVGATARTRLAEAGSSLVQARQLAATDPAHALAAAQRANDLAAQALQHAQNDVGAFGGGGFGGGNGGGGGNVMGAVLGGILINSMLGGGGGGRRGGGGMPSFGSRGGGMSSGSFGGGGTRSRRGGGRF